jgi:hypothetical protein
MLGNAQWSGLVGQDGTNVDGTKRGVVDSPFTAGISTPLSPTLSGFAMGLMQNLALSGGGAGTLIADEEGFIGWRINGPTRDACFVINATDETKTLAVPAGKSWAARRWQNNPWLTVTATSQVPSSVNATAAGGSNLAIPAFSLVVLTGIGGVVVPPAVYDVDFLNFQTSLPDVSWYKSPNAITTFAVGTGMTVSRNPEDGGFREAYVISPAFTPQQGQIIEIDFIGAGGTAGSNDASVGIGELIPGTPNAIAWLPNNTLFDGITGIGTTSAYNTGSILRFRATIQGLNASCQFLVDTLGNGTFTQVGATLLLPLTTAMQSSMSVCIDAAAAPLVIRRIRF